MQFWKRVKTVVRNLFAKETVEADLDQEIQSYRSLLEDEKIRDGVEARVAGREASLETGRVDEIKENVRDVRLGVMLETTASELRHAIRGLRRNGGLTFVAMLMLTLGMGASTLMFSIFYAALVQPLPFRNAERLLQIWENRLDRGLKQCSFSEANFWDVRAQNRSFDEVAAYHFDEANLTGDGPAEKVVAVEITSGFLRTLGVSPVLGRDFTYEEDRNGFKSTVAIVGHRFWKKRFGGDPNILGKTIRLNGRPHVVVGVLPAGEPWIDNQLYTPFGFRPDANRSSWEFAVIGRLKPGVTPQSAEADLQRIAAGLASAYPKDDKGIGFRVEGSDRWIASDVTRRALWVLLAAVTFLLLIACLNIANLLLARGTARHREVAVRAALGASRGRLMRFVIMESLVLSAFGAAAGIVLAFAGLHAIQSLELRGIPRLADASVNVWVLAFTAMMATLTGLLSGAAPAFQAPIDKIASALRDGDRQTNTRSQSSLRAALVTVEVALSFLLLVGAGLLIRSFVNMMSADRGFRTENRLIFSVGMPGAYYEKGVGKQFLDRLFERLSSLPEVIAVGAVSHRPVEGGDPGMGIDSPSQQRTNGIPWAGWRVVTPGYFNAIGLPLVRGRFFDQNDRPVWKERGQPPPQRRVIISERLAKLIFPNEDAIGKQVVLWKGQSGGEAEVVGVVGDSRERGLRSDPTLTVYLPYGRNALTSEVVVHTRGNPVALIPFVRSTIAELDPEVPVADVRSFEEVVRRSVTPQRFNAIVLTVFSVVALLLATTGIYGVLAYSMTRRTPEIGLRVALGATPRDILRITLGEGMRPALVGIVAGALAALWLSRYLATLLFGMKPFDAVTYAGVAVLLILTALAACYLPGRRAIRTDPTVALRAE